MTRPTPLLLLPCLRPACRPRPRTRHPKGQVRRACANPTCDTSPLPSEWFTRCWSWPASGRPMWFMISDRVMVEFRSPQQGIRSEEHTSELQSLMRISYAVFCLKKKTPKQIHIHTILTHTNITKRRSEP